MGDDDLHAVEGLGVQGIVQNVLCRKIDADTADQVTDGLSVGGDLGGVAVLHQQDGSVAGHGDLGKSQSGLGGVGVVFIKV